MAYQGVDFEDKRFPHNEDPDSRKSWTDHKQSYGMSFPNLPFFMDTDGFKMTEHFPIHQYIADKYMPELLGRNS